MRRRRPQPLLVLAFVLLMGGVMFAKKVPVSEQGMGLKMAATRLRVYYKESPPPKGWTVAEIASRKGEVWVDLVLSEIPAAALLDALPVTLRGQCPPKTDAAWSVLLPAQDIEVRGLGANGKSLAAVSCRAARK